MITKKEKKTEITEKTKMVVKMYLNGLNAPQIATQTKISKTSIYRYLKSAGIIPSLLFNERKRNRIALFTPEQDRHIADLYTKSKFSLNKLAQNFDCSTGAIKNALKREKIKMHAKGNRYREFSAEELKDIINRYQIKKQSQTYIAQKYKTHQVIVGRLLRQNNINPAKRRPKFDKHGSWKGGRHISSAGYIYVLLPDNHRFRSMCHSEGYIAEHRLIMAEHLGRPLKKSETVHHKDGVRTNNKIENLELRQGKHGKGVIMKCKDCGSYNIIST